MTNIRTGRLKCWIALFTVVLFIGITGILPSNATVADCGAVYKLSDDGSYAIITGYSFSSTSITVPSEVDGYPVKEINKYAFASYTSLTEITLPDSISVIGEGAFQNCTNLMSVTLPSGLTALPYECFSGCTMLKNITLPETLISIDDNCFEYCVKIGYLRIPSSVTEIGYDVFINCESLYLDVTENSYAAEYAARFNLNTDFKGTSQYFWLVIGIALICFAVVTAVIVTIYFAYLRRHPEKNPNNYIYKALWRCYNVAARCLKAVWELIITLITSLLWLLTKLFKKIRYGNIRSDKDIDNNTSEQNSDDE